MTAVIYQTSGTLTGTIEAEDVAKAQQYLLEDNMAQYLEAPLLGVVVRLQWLLHSDGHSYRVEAVCSRELTSAELLQLAEEVSGQNSDGLGEGFEQQDFAWNADGECGDCEGCENGYECESEDGQMVSFDWKTNPSHFARVV